MPYQRANLIRPGVITVADTPTPLFPENLPLLDAFWVLVMVRDLGTATYVRVGDNINQENSFMGVGDFQLWDVPDGYVFNAADLYAISDTGDAVVEVSGMYPGVS